MPTISTLSVDVVANTSRLRVGLAAAGTALVALGAAAGVALKAFEDSEKITAQTGAVLKSTGGAAHVTEQAVLDLASAISKKSAIDDETIQSGENLLLTFTKIRNEVGKGNDIFTQATSIITDMSVALGQDMKSSAIQVGKALQDPILGLTALRRVGVNFNEQQSEMVKKMVESGHQLEAQKFILHELTTEFGGSAEAQVTASAKMKVALNNLAETIGGLLAPAFTALAAGIVMVVEFLQVHAGPAFKAAITWFEALWDRIGPVIMAFAGPFLSALKSTWQAIQPLISALDKLWETFGPILKIVALVGIAFVALQVLIIGFILEILAKVVGFAAKVIDALASVAEWLKERFVAAWRAISGPVLAVIGGITNAILTLIHAVQTAIEWISKLGSNMPAPLTASGAPAIVPHGRPPGVQHGGEVLRTGLALVHRGEVFSGVNNEMGFGGGDLIIQIDGDTIARITRDKLLRLGARNGSTGLAGR